MRMKMMRSREDKELSLCGSSLSDVVLVDRDGDEFDDNSLRVEFAEIGRNDRWSMRDSIERDPFAITSPAPVLIP